MNGSEWLKKIEAEANAGGMLTAADGVALIEYIRRLETACRAPISMGNTGLLIFRQELDEMIDAGPNVPTP